MSHRHNRKKHLKSKVFTKSPQQQLDALLAYLGNYGDGEGIQPASDALFDSQIKNLSLSLASEFTKRDRGTVLDIGCGEGILLRRLVDIDGFKNNTRWIYFGTDHELNLNKVISLAVELGFHRRVDGYSLKAFNNAWPSEDVAPRPYVVVVRNVFHELDIDETAKLLHSIVNNLQQSDTLFVQDLQVFPVSERGNACWLPEKFKDLLSSIDFETTLVEEPTAKGNRWFTIIGRRQNGISPSYDSVRQAVIRERTKQYNYWQELGFIVPQDDKFREVRLAKIDFDLQCGALVQQLQKAKVSTIAPLTQIQERLILQETFAKHLSGFNLVESSASLDSFSHQNPFRDRKSEQDSLEAFLRDDDSTFIVIRGGGFSGKTELVKEVLSRRAYGKPMITLDVQLTSGIWNILEQFLVGIGCKVTSDIYGRLRLIKFSDVKTCIDDLVNRIGGQIVVVVDHFERLLDPNDEVQDREIQEFLGLIANAPGAKLILTTRRKPFLGFISPNKSWKTDIAPVGRFPRGDYVEHVLDDFVDRSKMRLEEYPHSLLEAIDRHPYLAVLAGMTIRKEGRGCLLDADLLESLRNRMRDSLIKRLVDDKTRPTIHIFSILRIPVPREMLESLAGKESVLACEEAGLAYDVYDRTSTRLMTSLGVFRRYSGDNEDVTDLDDLEEITGETKDEHLRIAEQYERLYRTNNDPRWVRELHYHKLATGDPEQIQQFGVVFRDEVFWAGEYWYLKLKNYKAALWAFEISRKLGLVTVHTEMRRAACMMRENKSGGEELFDELISTYPNAQNIKTAYIDSILFLKKYDMAYSKLCEFEFKLTDSPWIAHEYGRAYFGLDQYQQAVSAFETQLSMEFEPKPFVYDFLARTYQKVGDFDNESRILKMAQQRHPKNLRLRLRYASHLIRIGAEDASEEAYQILEPLYKLQPTNGRVLQQFCKLLCRTARVDMAETIWRTYKGEITPPEYETSIYVEILIRQEDWTGALNELKDISPDNIHLTCMKKEVYLAWAESETEETKRQIIAKQGLEIDVRSVVETSIPLLVTSARLARLAGKDDLFEEISGKLDALNPRVAENLRRGEVLYSYWEDG